MKVVIAGINFPNSLERNLLVTLRALGHTAKYALDFTWQYHKNRLIRFGFNTLSHYPRFEIYRSLRIARQTILTKPDLFISVYSWLRPEAVKKIHDAGIKTVLLYPDHIVNLGRQYALLAPYHRLYFKDPYAIRTFREKACLPMEYLPEACNPMWHKTLQLTDTDIMKYKCDITTASNMYPYRLRVMECLQGYDVKLWGPAWPLWMNSPMRTYHTGVAVREFEKAKAFNAAKIVINTMHYGEIEGVNCRTFEAAGCGAFQIADWKPALPDLFVPDQEIVTFASREELKDKVDYYLSHTDERRRIAKAGQIRAHRDHTYAQRIKRIFESLSI